MKSGKNSRRFRYLIIKSGRGIVKKKRVSIVSEKRIEHSLIVADDDLVVDDDDRDSLLAADVDQLLTDLVILFHVLLLIFKALLPQVFFDLEAERACCFSIYNHVFFHGFSFPDHAGNSQGESTFYN